MAEHSYQDAVQVLRDRLGGHWQGLEADGRGEMVAILKDALGYTTHRANEAIDAMIESGTLRYHRTDDRRDEAVVPLVTPAPLGSGSPPVGEVLGVAQAGHWDIGSEGSGEVDELGRKGQVTPR